MSFCDDESQVTCSSILQRVFRNFAPFLNRQSSSLCFAPVPCSGGRNLDRSEMGQSKLTGDLEKLLLRRHYRVFVGRFECVHNNSNRSFFVVSASKLNQIKDQFTNARIAMARIFAEDVLPTCENTGRHPTRLRVSYCIKQIPRAWSRRNAMLKNERENPKSKLLQTISQDGIKAVSPGDTFRRFESTGQEYGCEKR